MPFKRNQLEDAISSLVEPKARRPSARLRTRLKRLLEIDRDLGRSLRSPNPALSQYAFFSNDPPGRGVEVHFSDYEGFALLTSFQLMKHGWAQNLAVSILRRARTELEVHHTKILKLCRAGKASELTFEHTTPLLVIITSAGAAPDSDLEAFACSVCEGYRKAVKWISEESKPGHGFSMFELAFNAHLLAVQLEKTAPRHRGLPG